MDFIQTHSTSHHFYLNNLMEVFDSLIQEVRDNITNIETSVRTNLNKFEDKIRKYNQVDGLIEKYCEEYKDKTVTLDVGGKIFRLTVPKLLSCRDSLFNQLFIDDKDAFLNEDYFIDRDPANFKYILEYLTLGNISLPRNDPEPIIKELKYYNMTSPLVNPKKFEKNVVDYIDVEINGQFVIPDSSTNLEDLKDNNHEAAICCTGSNGHIIFELEDLVKISKFEIRGVTVNDKLWSPCEGIKGQVYLSTNKLTWTKVAKIPKNYGRGISQVKCNTMLAKYVKFTHLVKLGIGYLRIYFDD
jgi:hypothetical protein